MRFVETLETTRLLLRRPTVEDVAVLSGLWRDEQVQQFMGGVLSQQEADARVIDILKRWEDTGAGLWSVCEQGKDEPSGICGLGMFEEEMQIIYKLFPDIWGRGYATEAATAALAYGFQAWQLERIVGITQEANRASQHVLEKLGMHHVCSFWMWEAPQRYYELTRIESGVAMNSWDGGAGRN